MTAPFQTHKEARWYAVLWLTATLVCVALLVISANDPPAREVMVPVATLGLSILVVSAGAALVAWWRSTR